MALSKDLVEAFRCLLGHRHSFPMTSISGELLANPLAIHTKSQNGFTQMCTKQTDDKFCENILFLSLQKCFPCKRFSSNSCSSCWSKVQRAFVASNVIHLPETADQLYAHSLLVGMGPITAGVAKTLRRKAKHNEVGEWTSEASTIPPPLANQRLHIVLCLSSPD